MTDDKLQALAREIIERHQYELKSDRLHGGWYGGYPEELHAQIAAALKRHGEEQEERIRKLLAAINSAHLTPCTRAQSACVACTILELAEEL